MAREIKFRGMDIDGNWHIGNLAVMTKKVGVVDIGSYISNETGVPFAYQVRPETVGQYTGLKDRDGNEIYKGDITEYGWAITWHNGCLGRWYDGQFASMNELDISRIEVIGNIYEHPHLLLPEAIEPNESPSEAAAARGLLSGDQ